MWLRDLIRFGTEARVQDLPEEYYLLLRSCISDMYFRVKQEDEFSDIKNIAAGLPQRNALVTILYLVYTRDIQIAEETLVSILRMALLC